MGLFDPTSVKELRKQAEFIGGLHGQVHRGGLAADDVADLVGDATWRDKMRGLLRAAASDVGEDKARKAAAKAARLGAESHARLGGGGDLRPVMDQAEHNVLEMTA